MLKECVILNGQIINIGQWDYQIMRVEIEPAKINDAGDIIMEAVYEDRVTNPIPEGAVIEQRNFIQNSDSGWVQASDYAALRSVAYPPYSPFDILDEVLKLISPVPGSKLEKIINERNEVKQQYPKSQK